MSQTFDQFLAESGQQSTLDELRRTGKYDQALQAYNAGGSSGMSISGSSSGGGDWSSAVSQVAPQYLNMFGGTVSALEQNAQQAMDIAKQVSEKKLSTIEDTNNIYAALAKQLEAAAAREQTTLETEKKQKIGTQKQAAAVGGFDTTSGFEAAQLNVTEQKANTMIAEAADRWQINREKLAAEQKKDIKTIQAEAAEALFSGNQAQLQTLVQIAGLKEKQQSLITQAATAVMNAQTEKEKLAVDTWYKTEALKLQKAELDLNAQKLSQSGDKEVPEWQVKAQDLSTLRQLLAAGRAEGKSTSQILKDYTVAGYGSTLTPEEMQAEADYFTSDQAGGVGAKDTGVIYTAPQTEQQSGGWFDGLMNMWNQFKSGVS